MCKRDHDVDINIDPDILTLLDHLCTWREYRDVRIDNCISKTIQIL
jgi:hypothetical protein